MSEIRVNNVIADNGLDAVNFAKGINVSSGIITATSFSGSGASLTSLPAANLTGTLPAISGASLTGLTAGITMMDQWRITGDNTKTNGQVIDSNWERTDTLFAQIGTGMSESSGIFTFPQTGIYLLMGQSQMNGGASYAGFAIQASSNSGGSYVSLTEGYQNMSTVGGYHHITLHGIVDVTNASTFRVRMEAVNNASTQYSGSTSYLRNGLTFIRIGDT